MNIYYFHLPITVVAVACALCILNNGTGNVINRQRWQLLSIGRGGGYMGRISRWSRGPNSSAGLGHWLVAAVEGILPPWPLMACPPLATHAFASTSPCHHWPLWPLRHPGQWPFLSCCLVSLLDLNFKPQKQERMYLTYHLPCCPLSHKWQVTKAMVKWGVISWKHLTCLPVYSWTTA